MKRYRVIASAYACEPNKGSEPGIGWNIVSSLSRDHEMWVITRENNRPAIEAALACLTARHLHFVYFDLPNWARWWKKGTRGLQLYYYLWQVGAYLVARRLHRERPFDLAHHITFGRYWNPALLALLPIPFVWGPVGGGESAPRAFLSPLDVRSRLYEAIRDAVRQLGEHDPFVRHTASRSRVALATTDETARRLRRLGARRVEVAGNVGLNLEEIADLSTVPIPGPAPLRFISMGRLLHWKGFDLAMRAFAAAGLERSEYWLVGDGPERAKLEKLARVLGIADRVRFVGSVPRKQAIEDLGRCSVLLHPSLHDSGGWVCIEAMAAGRPVVCLDLGGPAILIDALSGFSIPAITPEAAVEEMAAALRALAADDQLLKAMGQQARRRVKERFTWERKVAQIAAAYAAALGTADAVTRMRASMPEGVE